MRKFLLALAMVTLLGSAAKAESLWSMVESRHFTFIAYHVNTSFTQSDPRFSTLAEGRYKMEVTKKWLDCKLPFFGKVYRNAMNDQHIEIYADKYTYEYKKVKRRKTTDILVKISARSTDDSDRFDMSLLINESGNATLTVSSNNRETITFQGRVEELKLYR